MDNFEINKKNIAAAHQDMMGAEGSINERSPHFKVLHQQCADRSWHGRVPLLPSRGTVIRINPQLVKHGSIFKP